MAKQHTLPSFNAPIPSQEPAITEGYKARTVTAQLKGECRNKFKSLTRFLDDTQATLNDGSLVSDKKCRVVLWLIENFELPKQ